MKKSNGWLMNYGLNPKWWKKDFERWKRMELEDKTEIAVMWCIFAGVAVSTVAFVCLCLSLCYSYIVG